MSIFDDKHRVSVTSTTSSSTPPPYSPPAALTGETLTLHAPSRLKPNLSITTSLGNQKFYLTYHRCKEPDLRLHLGSQEGPIVAVAVIKSWSRTYHLGLADSHVADTFTAKGNEVSTSKTSRGVLDDEAMTWRKAKTPWYPKIPTWTYEGKTYVLKRTYVDENGTRYEKARWRPYFGVYDEDGTVVALYAPNGGCGWRTATLRFAQGVEEGLEMCIILSVCCWREEMRRAG